MEIIVGKPIHVGDAISKRKSGSGSAVEAKVLGIRKSRNGWVRSQAHKTERRTGQKASDPVNARVLTLLIQDAPDIPKDIETGDYRVFLRFTSK